MSIFEKDFEPMSGFGKFIHILTWPIRRFYIVIPFLALLYVTPVFFEANPRKVHVWYKDKAVECYYKALEVPFISTSVNKALSLLGMDNLEDVRPNHKEESKKLDGLVDMHKARTKVHSRKGFDVSKDLYKFEVEGVSEYSEKSNYAEVKEDTTNMEDLIEKTDNAIKEKTVTINDINKLPNSSLKSLKSNAKAQKLPLIYLDTPKDITGFAIIKNSNELEINGLYMLLYGIYIHPLTADGKRSQAYLEGRTKDKEVTCSIVAHTYQKIATAICFVDGENLNDSLVRQGITKNISL